MHLDSKKIFYHDATPLLIAVDCIIFGFHDGELKLLLFKRKIEPFKDKWSIIGSFIKKEESVKSAASRVLKKHAGLQNIFMEPLGCFGEVERDPGARVISQAFFALIRIGQDEIKTVNTHQAKWFDLDLIPELILDHNQMVNEALEKLRRKTRYSPLGFELLPKKFTIPQLQKLYEEIYQKKLDARNFRKKILAMNIMIKLDEKDKTSSKKGAFLYSFNQKKYEKMMDKGINFLL
jgi:8-oxo-dGTP diphosphatase